MAAAMKLASAVPDGAKVLPQYIPKGRYLITNKVLGSGSTGKVMLALRKSDMGRVAVKVIVKANEKVKEEAFREIQLLLLLTHKNIIKIEHLDEDEKYLFIFTELLDQGDLFSYIQRHGPLTENHARILFRQMAEALHYCHQRNICHHDFKLENCVINKHLELRVIDFAYAVQCKPGEVITRFPGSPAYSAPEVLYRQPHGPTVDIFSLGTSLFYMLTGYFPFCDEEKTSYEELCRNVSQFQPILPRTVSPEACDLIMAMLSMTNRITWPELFEHAWIKRQQQPQTSPEPSPSRSRQRRLSREILADEDTEV